MLKFGNFDSLNFLFWKLRNIRTAKRQIFEVGGGGGCVVLLLLGFGKKASQVECYKTIEP